MYTHKERAIYYYSFPEQYYTTPTTVLSTAPYPFHQPTIEATRIESGHGMPTHPILFGELDYLCIFRYIEPDMSQKITYREMRSTAW